MQKGFPVGAGQTVGSLTPAKLVSKVSALRGSMPVHKITVGQVWKKNDSGENFLVTKVYTEALATFVMLRKTGAEEEARLRVKVERAGEYQTLPGFVYAQEAENF